MYFFYYYPIGVDVPRARIPFVTWLLVFGLTAIFVLSVAFPQLTSIPWWAYGYRPATANLLTPLTACLLHATWMHLLGNLVYLWVFGPALERALGHLGLLIAFGGCGYLGNLAQGVVVLHWMPHNAYGMVVGASGAISGLLGLFLLRFYFARIRVAWWAFLPLQGINRTGTSHVPVAVALLLWVILQVALALVHSGSGGVAYGAHLGGLAVGVVLGASLGLSQRGRVERLMASANRARDAGNVHEAIGLLGRYLKEAPWDEAARLERARLLCARGQWGDAQQVYRAVIQDRLRAGDFEGACQLYLEARRGNASFVLSPRAQRRMAFWLEKSTRFAWASTAYLDYARFYAAQDGADVALARAATLMLTRVGDREEGLSMLQRAIDEHPRSPWRRMLEDELVRLGGTLSV